MFQRLDELQTGSLYILTLTGVTKWGAVTPLGGLAFLVGWLSLSFAASALPGSDSSVPNALHPTAAAVSAHAMTATAHACPRRRIPTIYQRSAIKETTCQPPFSTTMSWVRTHPRASMTMW